MTVEKERQEIIGKLAGRLTSDDVCSIEDLIGAMLEGLIDASRDTIQIDAIKSYTLIGHPTNDAGAAARLAGSVGVYHGLMVARKAAWGELEELRNAIEKRGGQ